MPMKNYLIAAIILLNLSASSALSDTAYFAGGCFWCMEADFEKLKGVSEVISGFSGGTLENPTYNGKHEGHYETVQVIYDPETVSYKALLDYFWHHIDPFDDQGQFCDKGFSYRSAIFVNNQSEKNLAEHSRSKIQSQFANHKVVTPILDFTRFYPIKGKESFHQDYYKNNPVRYNYYRWSCGRDKRLKQIWGEKN
jgi:peptide-methionine (S)-S-oxide reductase